MVERLLGATSLTVEAKSEIPRPRKLKKDTAATKPALRVSHLVYGRETRGQRVVYCKDPDPRCLNKAVSEAVVLHRWRHRKLTGHVFSGARLLPHVWRAIASAFPDKAETWWMNDEKAIAEKIQSARATKSVLWSALPTPKIFFALCQACGPERLNKLLSRHSSPAREKKFGTPDLFLFSVELRTGRISNVRFVEVKRPDEAVSPDQCEELKFLESLGLAARILRLQERSG